MKFGAHELPAPTAQAEGWVQYKFTFPNGYTGSVVQGFGTYGGSKGLWEVAVMQDDELVYSTPVTDDVLGWLDEEDVGEVLDQIAALPGVGS